MAKSKTIKTQNRKWLISYLIFNILIFALFSGILALSLKDIEKLITQLKSPDGLFLLIAFPLTIVLEGILRPDIKAMLIFIRIKNPLPGCRAFSEIAPKDPRIDVNKLRKTFPGGLPSEPEEQNREWYQLYRKHEIKPTVNDAHRAFLLTRDLAALTAIMIPVTIIAHAIWNTSTLKIVYHCLFLIGILVLTMLASRNYGKRFVANVIVEETL